LHLSNVISYKNKARSKLYLQLSLIDTTIQPTLLDDIKNAQIKDNQCVRYLHGEINLNSNTNNHFSIDSEHNLVLYNNRYYIPNNNILRNKLLKQFHDNSGHIGVQKTHELISRQVYWKNLYDDIVEYVKQCIPCQRNKPSNQHPHGLLQPLEIPEAPWQSVSMDFITGLPKTRSIGYDCLLTITDRLTKMIHLIPTFTTATAKDIATQFLRHVVRYHGLPQSIVSDRDTKFSSNFWQSIMKLLNVELKMSSADHPETDGQSERTNRTVVEMLRHYVNEQNTDWIDYLPFIEICINNSKQASTGYSPYYLNCGYHPNFLNLYNNSKTKSNTPAAEEYFENIKNSINAAKQSLHKSQLNQSKYANRTRREHLFKVGDKVFIQSNHLKQQSGISKLNPLSRGPFTITRQNGKNNFSLDLPATWKIHNSFHVSKLKLANVNNNQKFPLRQNSIPPEPEIQEDGSKEYYVDRIVDHRTRYNRTEYRVRWKGYSADDDTWETERTLNKVRHLIREYKNSLNLIQLNTTQLHRNVLRNPDRIQLSFQCKANTNRGYRCRNRTRRSEYCQPHLMKYKNLRITNSGIKNAGLGLYNAYRPIRRHQRIIDYTGDESITPINGNYVLEVNKNKFINANRSTDIAGYMNDCRCINRRNKECSGNNAKFTYDKIGKRVYLTATRNIAPKEELYVSYGRSYWSKMPKVY